MILVQELLKNKLRNFSARRWLFLLQKRRSYKKKINEWGKKFALREAQGQWEEYKAYGDLPSVPVWIKEFEENILTDDSDLGNDFWAIPGMWDKDCPTETGKKVSAEVAEITKELYVKMIRRILRELQDSEKRIEKFN